MSQHCVWVGFSHEQTRDKDGSDSGSPGGGVGKGDWKQEVGSAGAWTG